MKAFISKPVDGLKGTARVPGDKSISHRALMLGAIAKGDTLVTGLLEGEDVIGTFRALQALGAAITPPAVPGGAWHIRGLGDQPLKAPKSALYLGNSGTSARLLMGLVAGYPIHALFTGDQSLSRRPMGRVMKPLAQMGARFETSTADMLPIRVVGSHHLRPIHYVMPMASAQVKSAILLAARHPRSGTTIVEPQPTRDHTELMMNYMGGKVSSKIQKDGSAIVTIQGGHALEGRAISIPADPSSAAFLVVAALVTKDSNIVIPAVLVNPRRTGIFDTLKEMGADIAFENLRESSGEQVADIHVKSSRLKGVTVPAERVPSMIDEFPILSIAAAFAEGKTVMTDLAELRVKESDRLSAIAKGLEAAGVKVEAGADILTVHGASSVKGGCTVKTHLDHRIAMSFLVLGLAADEAVTVDDEESIATSFPDFARLMNGLGAKMGPV